MKLLIFVTLLLTTSFGFSKAALLTNPKIQEFHHDALSFDYIATDGSYWYDCKHDKGSQPHSWTVYCDRFIFKLHLMLNEYQRENETTFEFHYWADEFDNLNETHTQSTWLTVDKKAKTKKIVGYLGFLKDAAQLRIEVNPN